MNISSRFFAIGIVCAVTAASIGATLVVMTNRVSEELRKNRAAADVVGAVSGLRYLTLEYLLHPEERVEVQWQIRQASLGQLVASSLRLDSGAEQVSVQRMREAQSDVTSAFAELLEAQRARTAGEGNPELIEELIRRLTTIVINKQQVMIMEALRLQDITLERVGNAQRNTIASILALSVALVLVIVATLYFAFRSIARPVARLREGTELVGAGNLDHMIGVPVHDEIGELARAFDQMTVKLRATTVSRDELAESEERTRLILETALDAVVSIDASGAITGWNSQAESVFGWTHPEVLGRSLAETVIPYRRREDYRHGLQRYLATGDLAVLNKRIELTALHRDGHEFPVELAMTPVRSGRAVTFCAFVRDITERRQAEGKLQAQLARLDLLNRITQAIGERQDLQSMFQVLIRSLEDNSPIDFSCVCLHDPLRDELKVVAVGGKSAQLALELATKEHALIAIEENRLSRCLQGRLIYEPDIVQTPFPFLQRLAREGLASLVVAPLLVESKVFGVLLAARREAHGFSSGDCEFLQQLSAHVALAAHQAHLYAALQQAYDDVRQTQQAVMQQERLRVLGQIASGVAHDINNALSPVALYTESLLEREPNLSPRARNHLTTIQRAVDNVAQTVSRMREFYRQRDPQLVLARLDVNRMVEQVIALTRARWSDVPQERGVVIKLKTELATDLPAILGAEAEIRNAFTNLIFNAVDAMPEGGTLTLRTGVMSPDAQAEGIAPRQHVRLEVCDTGIGMDQETRRRCLEPFFTTKGERGTGLGLAMVYGMAERHGAELEIDSKVGEGTTMRLIFPVATPSVAAAARFQSPPTHAQRLCILIIDDDPLLIQSLRSTLEADGHTVTAADGGQAGIDAFLAARDRGEPFAVVITDLGMPYVDGRKVAAAVRAASPDTPVILLTGWGQRLVAEGDVPSEVNCVLSKPPKLHEIRAALDELTFSSGHVFLP